MAAVPVASAATTSVRNTRSPLAICGEIDRLGDAHEALRLARGDATVLAYAVDFPGVDDVAQRARAAGASRAEPTLVFEAHVMGPRRMYRLAVQGRTARSLDAVRSYVGAGDIDTLTDGRPRVVLGEELAEGLGVSVGDTIGLVAIVEDVSSGRAARHGSRVEAEVAALLRFPGDALSALEMNEIVLELGAAQRVWGAASGRHAVVSAITVTFDRADQAPAGLDAIRSAVADGPYRIVPLAELVQSQAAAEDALRIFCDRRSVR